MDFHRIIGFYTNDRIRSVRELEEGHINDTFLVDAEGGRYVLQRLQPKMDPVKLENNYMLYAPAFQTHNLLYPKWVKGQNGQFFYSDEEGILWRMYSYLDGEVLTAPLTGEELFACGEGLAGMHEILKKLPGRPNAVYPMLHDLKYYGEEYRRAQKNPDRMEENRDPELEEKIERGIERFTNYDPGPVGIVHGDAKLSNILFRDGRVVGFLDLDTVMTGSYAEEVADCIRSACVREGRLDRKAAKELLEGYANSGSDIAIGLRESAKQYSPEELIGSKALVLECVPMAFEKICFELALRYYTDAISPVKHFKENYPGYRLEKARERMALVEEFNG